MIRNFLLFMAFFLMVFAPFGSVAYAADYELSKEDKASIASSLDDDDEYLDAVSIVTPDPFEGYNRSMFTFNDAFINYIAKPVYKGYSYITPSFFRQGAKNFFHNLGFPIRFLNNIFQGKGKAAGVEMSRFILNTTAGLGGLFDVAKRHAPLFPPNEGDFGQTLGVWGFGEGFYIVWPLLGPSTARDTLGISGDYFLDPLFFVKPRWTSLGIASFKYFNYLDEIIDSYDSMKRISIEPYTSVRDAYTQYRRAKVAK